MKDFWFQKDDYDCHSAVFDHVEQVEQDQSVRHKLNRLHAQLYSNRYEPGFDGYASMYRDENKVTENVIASVIDTASSLIAKSTPRIEFLTDKGEWGVQQLAKALERYTAGQFQAMGTYKVMPMMFRDACVWGTGGVEIYTEDGDVKIRRALIDDVVVDEAEVPAGGTPRQLHHYRLVYKEALKCKYPEDATKIDEAGKGERYDHIKYRNVDPELVVVLESWYLSPDKKKPGRHTICTDNHTLADEDYDKPYFPFIFFKWSEPLTGWYGQGLAEALMGHQVRLAELNDFIRKCQDLIAVPRVWLPLGSRVNNIQIDNRIGAIIHGAAEPKFSTAQAVGPEVYAYKEQLKASAFEFAGISKMAAQATRPEGIEAAVALRELSDNQSQRFSLQHQRYEEAFVDMAHIVIDQSRDIAASGRKPKVWNADRTVRDIDWKATDPDLNRYVMKPMPASILGETPAGRRQAVIELAQYGVVLDQDELRGLLEHPDLKRSNEHAMAQDDYLEWVVKRLSEGEYEAPDPLQDLQKAIRKITAAYLIARQVKDTVTGKEREEVERALEAYRQFIIQAQDLLTPPAPPMPPEAGPLPDGVTTETALPGLVDPATQDTAETGLPGILNARQGI